MVKSRWTVVFSGHVVVFDADDEDDARHWVRVQIFLRESRFSADRYYRVVRTLRKLG